MKVLVLSSLAGLLAAGSAHAAGDADLLRCLDQADSVARLACYDKLATAVRQAGSAPATTSTSATTSAQDFGRPTPAPSPTRDQLVSQIAGSFDGWTKGHTVKLVNGQVWQLLDEGTVFRALQDPQVTIKPSALSSSYFMKVEGLSFQIKVKRVQ